MKFVFNNNQLSISGELHDKMLLMHQRITEYNNDCLLIVDGDTGTGKSNIASLICAYYSSISSRSYTVDNVFFDSDSLVAFAINSKEQIIHFDESLFSAMASDWQTKEQRKLIKMLLLARKKKHFFVFCIPDFFSLKKTIKLDKSIGLIHTYLEDGIKPGQFVYYNKELKDKMNNIWNKTGIKAYKNSYNFRDRFSPVLGKIINEDAYETKKDKAILSLDAQNTDKDAKLIGEINELKETIHMVGIKYGISQEELAKDFKRSSRTLREWKNATKKAQIPSESAFSMDLEGRKLTNNSVVEENIGEDDSEGPIGIG